MADTTKILTPHGREALQTELDELVQLRRPEIVARVASTRAEGDLKENFGYHDARQELGMLDGRVQEIEALLRTAVVVDRVVHNGMVGLMSKVDMSDEYGDSTFEIVGTSEADPAKGRISIESPLAKALLGHKAGDVVTYEAPAGKCTVTVVKVV